MVRSISRSSHTDAAFRIDPVSSSSEVLKEMSFLREVISTKKRVNLYLTDNGHCVSPAVLRSPTFCVLPVLLLGMHLR